jgi:hypothetical protein
MRLLLTLAASSVSALLAFRSVRPHDDSLADALWDGAMVGGAIFGVIRLGELLDKHRLPAWIVIPTVAVLTAVAYRWWTLWFV